MYDEGEDATKAVYIAKMEEIQTLSGPIAQRYFDKMEEQRAAAQAIADAEAAKKREMAEAAKKAALAQEAAAKKEESTDAEQMNLDEVTEPETK